MAFLSASRPHFELLAIKTQLSEGLISATDASRLVAEIVFEAGRPMLMTPSSNAWRKFDEAMADKLHALIDEITKY